MTMSTYSKLYEDPTATQEIRLICKIQRLEKNREITKHIVQQAEVPRDLWPTQNL